MVRAEEAISIYQRLLAAGIQVWLTGGWGIDALLQEQTRPHKDLDVIMLVDDVARMREILGRDGYGSGYLWSENRWVADAHGAETATAFVLQDGEGRELDAHAMRLDDRGHGVPAWEAEGLAFERQDLAGEGLIAGFAVRCIAPEMQMACHMGYQLPEVQLHDLELLRERFGVELPVEGASERVVWQPPIEADPMKLNIREAVASDYDDLCALFEEADALHRENLPRIFQKPGGAARGRDYVDGLITDDAVGFFVAQAGDRLVGLIYVMIRESPDVPILTRRRYAVVDTVVVKNEYRRAGIGRALMEKTREWAVAEGADSIELHVWEFNQGAIEFYRALGYETASRRMSMWLS